MTKEELNKIVNTILIRHEFKKLEKHLQTVYIFNKYGECINTSLHKAEVMCLETGCSSKEAIELIMKQDL